MLSPARALPRPITPLPATPTPRVPSDKLAVACFVGFVCTAPQLLGGALPETVPLIAAAAIATLFTAMWTARERDAAVTPLVVVMLAALAWTAVQALPLPCGWVRVLHPTAVDDLGRALRLLDRPTPATCTLSLDPGATRAEVVKGLALVAAFLSGLLLAARSERRTVYRAVALSGALMGVVAMVHTASHAERIFGIYRPVYVRDAPTVAPLLNPNALGGFLAMCVPLCVGLAFSERSKLRRTLAVIAAGVLATCTLMTRSRGAAIALALGLGALAVLAWFRWSRRGRDRASGRVDLTRLAVASSVTLALALGILAWRTTLVAEFRGGSLAKLDLIGAAFRLGWQNPWLGVGRGAFASGFPRAYPTPHRFDHAENFVAQWASEWGWPLTLLLLGTVAYACARRLRAPRSLASLGALAALVTLAAHNLADLGLELAGVASVASALLGATTARSVPRVRKGRGSCLRVAAALCAIGALGLAVLAPTLARDDTESLVAGLRRGLERGDHAEFRATLAQAVSLHPARPEFAVLASAEALARDSPDAGRWINRAMQLAPGWATPHVHAVQWLWRAGYHRQAIVELGAAAARDVHVLGPFLCPLARYDPGAVVRVAPPGTAGGTFLQMASRCLFPDSEGGRTIDEALARDHPDLAWARLRTIERWLAAGEVERAAREARAMRQAGHGGDDAVLLEARCLVRLNRAAEAVRLLADAASRSASPQPLLELEARTLAATGADAGMRQALERLRGSAGGQPSGLRDAWMLEGELETSLGNLGRALHAYAEAHRITGDIDALARSAEVAERIGDARRAFQAYSRLCDVAPERGACAKRDALGAAPGASPAP